MTTKLQPTAVKIIKNRVKTYDDVTLLNATIGLAGGDDYDGEFTAEGSYEFEQHRKELAKRLKKIGFLKKGINSSGMFE